MISYNYETDFKLNDEPKITRWLQSLIVEEHYELEAINYIFCTDAYLHKINLDFLNHDTYTDIISFDYSVRKRLYGDIYISVDRVRENAITYGTSFYSEMLRVIAHGVLHFCGYNDKSAVDQTMMRGKEEYYISKLL